jgi:prolyl-tRNA synthetase
MCVRRDTHAKTPLEVEGLEERLPGLLEEIQGAMLARARTMLEERTHAANSMEEFERLLDDPGGFVSASWDGTDATELEIKERTKATIRVLDDASDEPGPCIVTGKPAERRALFARAY